MGEPSKWISTEEAKPEIGKSVPILIRRKDLDGKLHPSMGFYKNKVWWYRMPGQQYIIRHPVEFWLPMPKIPE